MGLISKIKIVRSLGIANIVSLLQDRLFNRKSSTFLTLRSKFFGVGLEIGGPSKVFSKHGYWPVYPIAHRIDNVNFCDVTAWHGSIFDGNNFIFNSNKDSGRQYIGDARDLSWIPDSSYEFILSSHMLEHSANPLKILLSCKHVLKDGGVVILVLPHKNGTFDHKRAITPLEHLQLDLKLDTAEDDTTHFDEILSLHDLSRDPSQGSFLEFKIWIDNNFENRGAHHHVFSSLSAAKLVDLAGFEILDVEARRPYNIFIAARKSSAGSVNNDAFLTSKPAYLIRSPFAADKLGLG